MQGRLDDDRLHRRLQVLRRLLRQVLLLTPYARSYWLGLVDARPLALFRIAFGAVVLADAIERWGELRVFYSDEGIVPLSAEITHGWMRSPLAALVHSPTEAALLLGVGAVAALAFAAGLYARAASVALWLYLLTIASRNALVLDGGDAVMMALAFFAMFADVDAVWSLRRGPPRPRVPAFAVRLLELQLALVYFCAGVAKHGATWWHGEAIFRVLQNNDFARPLGMALTASPTLCALLTFATLVVELGFLPLVLSPWRTATTRAVAAAAAALLHVGIFALMRVGMFPFVMLAALCLFVPPSLLDRQRRAPVDGATQRPLPRWLAVALSLLLAAATVDSLAPRRMPDAVAKPLFHLGVAQDWRMFAPEGSLHDGYFSASGRLADGSSVDPLRAVMPAMLPQAALRYSRWYKLRDNAVDSGMVQLLLLDYACRQLRSPPLVDATLRYWQRPTRRPGEPSQRFTLESERSWACRR
jgi:vitamin K-dependent gamma-carboxylase-like protein